MQSRRTFLKLGMALGGGIFVSALNAKTSESESNRWVMPEESKLHKCTWMSFIASYDIWGERQVKEVQRNLAAIAKIIAKYQPVSILVRDIDYDIAAKLLGGLNNHNYPIDLIEKSRQFSKTEISKSVPEASD